MFARFVLRDSLLKKYQEGADGSADRGALDLFLHWNQRCADWQRPIPTTEIDAIILGEFQSLFAQCFERPDGELIDFWTEAHCYINTGPGAAVDTYSYTDYYSKVAAGELTCTDERLYWHYFENAQQFDLELEAELLRSKEFRTPVVKGSNLGFAPKNRVISRTRCSEPSLNMMYQLATGKILEMVLWDRFRIDLSTQPQLNQELARRGSISGRYGTTDQSSASDAIARKLWNWSMPYREIREWFDFIRSPATKLPNGDWVELHMVSSMGNGFTFPLMSLIYCCVIEAVYKALDIPLIRNHISRDGSTLLPGNFAVFGDDLIVVAEAFETLNRVLTLLGFAVNTDKSFGDGPFRESCGTDWFLGRNVRGVYCKKLRAPHNRYALINRLNAWSAEWDIPLRRVISYLKDSVWWIPVPPWENAYAGVMVPFDMALNRVKPCRPPSDDREPFYPGSVVYAGLRPIARTWDPCRGSPLSFLTGSPGGEFVGLLPDQVNKLRKEWNSSKLGFVNPSGILLAAARGRIRNGLVTVRDDNAKYVKRLCVAPGWGFTGTSQAGFTPEGWARFAGTLASVNLG